MSAKLPNEHIKAWITKYALTTGIEVVDAEVCHSINSSMISYGAGGYLYAHGKEWHRTPEQALARAEQMRYSKLNSLRKKMAALEHMKFTLPTGDKT
jgi:hypothetical protein